MGGNFEWEIFYMLDKNHDNFIVPGELKAFQTCNECSRLSYEDIMIIFGTMDKDEDGRIHYNESIPFLAAF